MVADLAHGYRLRSVPAVEQAPNVSQRGRELLIVVRACALAMPKSKTAAAVMPTAAPSAEVVFVWRSASLDPAPCRLPRR
jgi:hypothetical protein